MFRVVRPYVLNMNVVHFLSAQLPVCMPQFSGFCCKSLIVDTWFMIQTLNSKLLKAKDKRTRGDIRRELRMLGKEERQRQQQAVADVIKDSSVILTTLTGALTRQLRDTTYDVVIIDEAAQALEIACWIALLKVLICGFLWPATHIPTLYCF